MSLKGVMLSWGVPARSTPVKGFSPDRISPWFQDALAKTVTRVRPTVKGASTSPSTPWMRTSEKLIAWETVLLGLVGGRPQQPAATISVEMKPSYLLLK